MIDLIILVPARKFNHMQANRLKAHIDSLLAVVKDPVFQKQMLWMVGYGVFMVVFILWNINFLNTTYPDPPRPPDRILDLIPQDTAYMHIGEWLSSAQLAMMAFIVLSSADRLRRLPYMLFLLATMFIIRGFAITLTPLAQITPPEEYLPDSFIAQHFYHGMFFSGHSSSALIQAFYYWRDRVYGIRATWLVLPLALGQVWAMIAGHQHYTIDIFAAFFVVYFVLTFDFMRLVPARLKHVRWMPWYRPEEANAPAIEDDRQRTPARLDIT
jgi:hypothetical protein